jgi:hypothetical protein
MTEQKPEERMFPESSVQLFASIIEANTRDQQAITARLEDNLKTELTEWKTRYAELQEELRVIMKRTDSHSLYRLAQATSWEFGESLKPGWWED